MPKKVKPKNSRKKAVSKKVVKKAVRKPAAISKPAGKCNMLVTFDPSHTGIAELELKTVLKQIGEVPKIAKTEVNGLYKVYVKDAKAATKKVSSLVNTNPAIFVATRHYIPVDNWVKAEMADMKAAIKKACAGIAPKDKWKMCLNKRHWEKMDSMPLILRLTDVVESGQVDLDKPDKIIQIDIIANEAAISLLKPSDIADIQRIKAK
jgi:tRNA(Ser,Leu) C12 N-acetylase TAN1